jgi:O-antigen ligase
VYFPVRGLLCAAPTKRRFAAALSLGAFFCASVGILQYFFTDATAKWLDTERFSDISMRVTSTFRNPNVLCVYLLLCLPFALYGALDSALPRSHRLLFGITAMAVGLCTILTWTRGAWLGLLLQAACLILFYSKKTLAFGLLLLLFAPCTLPYLPQNVIHRFGSIGTLAESSIRYRIYTWQGVNKLIAAHPWGIGIGESAFCAVYPLHALPGIESVMHAHNVYLQIALECGVAGLAAFLILIVTVLLQSAPLCKNPAPLALLGVLVMGLFDHLWYFRPLAALFFVIVGCVGME